MNISRFFIDRPIFAAVLSILIFLVGAAGDLRSLPISEYPEVAPPQVVVRAQYPGANPRVIAETVATPLEEQINGVEDMLYMSSQATADGVHDADRHLQARHRPRSGRRPRCRTASQALPRLPEDVRQLGVTTDKSSPEPDDGRAPGLARRALRRAVPAQLRGAERHATSCCASPASARC